MPPQQHGAGGLARQEAVAVAGHHEALVAQVVLDGRGVEQAVGPDEQHLLDRAAVQQFEREAQRRGKTRAPQGQDARAAVKPQVELARGERDDRGVGARRHVRPLGFGREHQQGRAGRIEAVLRTQAVLDGQGGPARHALAAPAVCIGQGRDLDGGAGVGHEVTVLEVVHAGPQRATRCTQVIADGAAEAGRGDLQDCRRTVCGRAHAARA